jgi:hypothetical protein
MSTVWALSQQNIIQKDRPEKGWPCYWGVKVWNVSKSYTESMGSSVAPSKEILRQWYIYKTLHHSWYSDKTVGWTTEEMGLVPSRDKKYFFSLQYLDQLWVQPTSCSFLYCASFLGVKQLEREGNHSPAVVDVYRCPDHSSSGDTCSAIFEHGSSFIRALLQQCTVAILCW